MAGIDFGIFKFSADSNLLNFSGYSSNLISVLVPIVSAPALIISFHRCQITDTAGSFDLAGVAYRLSDQLDHIRRSRSLKPDAVLIYEAPFFRRNRRDSHDFFGSQRRS